MDRLSDHIFLKTYRLDRASFNELVEQIDPLIRRVAVKATASSGSEIPTRTRLAVTLRWLGGGTWCDIVFTYGISCSVFYSDRGVLWTTIEAIDAKLGLGFPLDDADEIEKCSRGFADHSGGAMAGAVIAIDGATNIEISKFG
ncbi:hypothetical protein B484DRAFT_462450 [Ochromonadaceae sp. CCMP2298]|nr:hypothetical protein B484DRAFT_462450 [Ochromonadaceae sp. CCMP2298]